MTSVTEVPTVGLSKHKPAKVFITSAYDDPEPITTFRTNANNDKWKVHSVVDNPEVADVILFIENSRFHSDYYFKKLLSHPLVRKYPEKTFMYNPHDIPWVMLRGLYANIPRNLFNEKYMRSSPYFETVNKFIYCDMDRTPQYLYSFYGAPSSKIRRAIFASTHHPRSKIIHSSQHMFFDSVKPKDPQVQYADLMADSKFVLAPKGIGTSSIRLFEILRAGRVPVLMSDDFVLPVGPDWNKIAVIVPENNVGSLPEILEREEASWPERAAAAKNAWDDYFGPEAVFHYFTENILDLKSYDFHMSAAMKLRNIVPFCRYAFRKKVIEKVAPVLKPVLKRMTGILTRGLPVDYKRVA